MADTIAGLQRKVQELEDRLATADVRADRAAAECQRLQAIEAEVLAMRDRAEKAEGAVLGQLADQTIVIKLEDRHWHWFVAHCQLRGIPLERRLQQILRGIYAEEGGGRLETGGTIPLEQLKDLM